LHSPLLAVQPLLLVLLVAPLLLRLASKQRRQALAARLTLARLRLLVALVLLVRF
jgi:hypothetical protein